MSNKLNQWDEMEDIDEPLSIPKEVEEEVTEEAVTSKSAVAYDLPVEAQLPANPTLSQEHEQIALAMLDVRGDIAKASRSDTVTHNAMALRAVVKNNPQIRKRYQELLTDELMDRGLHVTERILRMVDLQDKAMGCTVMVEGPEGLEEMDMPADPKMVIELSKEISRLIVEGRTQNISSKSALLLVSKEDAKEILADFLDS